MEYDEYGKNKSTALVLCLANC